jgi:hypothetical protein
VQDRFRLGQWVSVQRRRKITGKIPEHQIALLLRIGFEFDALAATWEKGYLAFAAYLKEHPGSLPPDQIRVDGIAILAWFRRNTYLLSRGKLSEDQTSRLKALGVPLKAKLESNWDRGFNAIKRFHEEHDSKAYPSGVKLYGFDLNSWAKSQRKKRQAGTLPERRVQLLNEIGFPWSPHAENWDAAFELLKKYAEKHGDTKIPDGADFEGFPLGAWLNKQRNTPHLTVERKAQLQKLGVSFTLRADAWDSSFAALQKHVSLTGNARPIRGEEIDQINIGAWVQKQRSRKGKLSQDQINRLEGLPGWTWSVREAQWRDGINALQHFRTRFGAKPVTQTHVEAGFKLGSWIANNKRRPGNLSPEERRELRELGIDI